MLKYTKSSEQQDLLLFEWTPVVYPPSNSGSQNEKTLNLPFCFSTELRNSLGPAGHLQMDDKQQCKWVCVNL